MALDERFEGSNTGLEGGEHDKRPDDTSRLEVFLTLCSYVCFGRFGLCSVKEDNHERFSLLAGKVTRRC